MKTIAKLLFAVAVSVAVISCGDSLLPTEPAASTSGLTLRADGLTGPTLSTDQLDYAPGDTVTIYGSGWQAGETITLLLTEDPAIHEPLQWEIQADAEGNFTDSSFIVEEHHVGVKFTLTATGASGSTVQTTFTDGNFIVKTNAGTMTVSWQFFSSSANCTTGGGAITSGVSVNTSNSNLVGATATQSVQVIITANPAGTTFLNWTGPSTVTNTTLCSAGAGGPGVSWIANFSEVTTTTVTANKASPQEFGTSVTFTAQVNTTGSGTPAVGTGTVAFYDGGSCSSPGPTLQAATAVSPSGGTKGSVAFTTTSLSVAAHTVLACYTGAPAYEPSSNSLAFTINDIATSTVVTANKSSPQEFGASIIFTATVTRANGPANVAVTTGSIGFYDGGTCATPGPELQAPAAVSGTGTKTFTTSSLGIAAHTILACFTPPTNFVASSGTLPFTITQIATTTTVTSDLTSPRLFGTSVVFTAEVNRTTGGADVLSGDVVFYDGGSCAVPGTTLQAAQPATTGTVTYTTSTLSAGAHTILACYLGTTDYVASFGTKAFTISAIPTTTVITALPVTPSELGTSVTFTATVTRTTGGTPVTVGQVKFVEGGNCSASEVQAAALLNGSGQVTFITSTLAVGGHNIRACYLPPAEYVASDDATVYMIQKIATTSTLTADKLSPQAAGTSIVFTAEVNRTTGGADVTEGAFTFYDGGTDCTTTGTLLQAATTVDGVGKATLTTSTLSIGVHTIFACYGGTASYRGSTASMSFTITVISTTTTLTVTPSTQQYSDKVTLSAAISPTAAPGSVQFQKNVNSGGFTNIGSAVTVVSGAASFVYTVVESSTDNVQLKAVFTSSSIGYGSSAGTGSLTVTKEDATVTFDASNLPAMQVSSPGGTLNAGALSMKVLVTETVPDLAATTAAAGNIANAGLTVTLTPIGGGSAITLNCGTGVVTGSAYTGVNTYTCTNSAALVVNAYEVNATVAGNYYVGSGVDAFTVYDPSLGFATGGGSFLISGDRVTFGFVMKYNRGGTNLQGNYLAVRHLAGGRIAKLKSNSLGALAITDNGCGVASFDGKATYTYWSGGQYVNTGNNAFTVYAEDCNNPGTGVDKFWMSGPSLLNIASPVSTNKTALTGGNISVPHTPQL